MNDTNGLLLDGLKVADFSWGAAAPLATGYLADFGAQVVKVESMAYLDTARLLIPYRDGKPGVNRSGNFLVYNNSKYSLSLDLGHPAARDVAERLVQWADVVVEAFRPGKMKDWHLDYDSIRKIKPEIVMVSQSVQGQTGPNSGFRGWGFSGGALVGFTRITGWPDRMPCGPGGGAIMDTLTPWFVATAILSAVDYRRRTGKGQYIDVSQYETGLHFLRTEMLDYVVNRKVPGSLGNRSNRAAPHGVYRCSGDEGWCIIAVFTEEEWTSFCSVLGSPAWTNDPKFNSLSGRKQHEDALDKLIEVETLRFSADELFKKMQFAGVPAAVVQSPKDLFEDPQLRHRNFFTTVKHQEIGECTIYGWPVQIAGAERKSLPAPCLGEHNAYVCTKLLGMKDEEFARLVQEGLFD